MTTRALVRIACVLYIAQALVGLGCGVAWALIHTGVL